MWKSLLDASSAPSPLMRAGVVASLVVQSFELYLKWRNYRKTLSCDGPPECLASTCTDEEFKEAKAYSLSQARFSLVSETFNMALDVAFKWTRFSPFIYYRTAALLAGTRCGAGGFCHGMLISITEDLIQMVLALPFKYYDVFVVEEKAGFNRMTLSRFVKDTAKGFLVRLGIGHPIQNALIVLIVRYFGERFPLYFTAACLSVSVVMIYVYPKYIMPLFDTYTPLDAESTLYKRLTALALPYEFRDIFVVDGSKKSGHSNAYVIGFWRCRIIVLYDTLQAQMNEDQVVAIVAHELGHWMCLHTVKMMGIGMLQLMALAFGARRFIFDKGLVAQFGYQETNAIIGFSVFSDFFFSTFSEVTGYALISISRSFEFQADRYAASRGFSRELQEGLLVIHKENKSYLENDWVYEALKASHPDVTERITALKRLEGKEATEDSSKKQQ